MLGQNLNGVCRWPIHKTEATSSIGDLRRRFFA
jgi:hypothetical protein